MALDLVGAQNSPALTTKEKDVIFRELYMLLVQNITKGTAAAAVASSRKKFEIKRPNQ